MSPWIKAKFTFRAFVGLLIVALPVLVLVGSTRQQASTQAKIGSVHEQLPLSPVTNHYDQGSGRNKYHRARRAAVIQGSRPTNTDTAVFGSTTSDFARRSPQDNSQQNRNQTAEYHVLTRRANPDPRADLNYYTCKGRRYLAENIQGARPNPPKWGFDDLERNGWVVSPGEITTFGIELQQAIFELDIPIEKEKNLQIHANLVNRFRNKNGVETEPQGPGGEFENRYILPEKISPTDPTVKPGTIIGTYNFSPKYYADVYLGGGEENPLEGDALEAAVPPMNSWADVVWAIWAHTAGSQAGDLRYIFQDNITTDITKKIIEMIEGVKEEDARSLNLPWPGHTFMMDSTEGLTLLGSPHGVGLSWLYYNGRAALGARNQIKVTIFSSPQPVDPPNSPTGFFNYYMLWDLGPRS
ncbi:MAG: hypothetical protein Q9208_003743 [Pyrenodesmia sp. 3 TL-2023]